MKKNHSSFLLLILCFLSLEFSCKSSNEKKEINSEVVNNPATANGESDHKLPVFSPDQESHDFGKVMEGESVTYNFKFKNTGNADLLIADATASCGCTVPEYPRKPIAPGADGAITVTFNSAGKEGKVSKTIAITSNAVPNTKVLTITCEVLTHSK